MVPINTQIITCEVAREIVGEAAVEAPKKPRKVFLSGLLGARIKKEVLAPLVIDKKDELEEYLEDTRTCRAATRTSSSGGVGGGLRNVGSIPASYDIG